MTMKKRSVDSLPDMIKKLRIDLQDYKEPVWYRGHGRSDWKLTPAYHRLSNPPDEVALINQFRQNANLLLTQAPKSDFDWLFIMQHYGVPTRLLDWSESPLVALYFAVTEHPDEDGALWILKPLELNRETTSKPDEVKYIPAFEDEAVQGYSTVAIGKGNLSGILPIAVLATRNTARIQAQLGAFTISHSTKMAIDDIGNKGHIIKYTIPSTAKTKIKEDLQLLAFTKFQVFPELSSIGDNIRGAL